MCVCIKRDNYLLLLLLILFTEQYSWNTMQVTILTDKSPWYFELSPNNPTDQEMSIPLGRERAAKSPRGDYQQRWGCEKGGHFYSLWAKGPLRRATERRVGLHEVAPNAHLKNPRTLCSWRVMSWILHIIDVTRPLSGGWTREKGRDV